MRSTALVLAVLASTAVAAGCKDETPLPSAEPPAGSAAAKGGPEVKTGTFTAKLETASAKAGEKGHAVVSVVPAAGYKVNQEYPYKFRFDAAPEGLTYPADVVTEVERTKELATMKLPFTAAKPGTYKVSGTCALSVCTEENCVIEKVPLAVNVKVD